jgi:cytochrome c oxidase cbb3-type subunit III
MKHLIIKKSILTLITLLVIAIPAYSQETTTIDGFVFRSDYILLAFVAILLIPIFILSRTLLALFKLHSEKDKKKVSGKLPMIVLPLFLFLGSQNAFGQEVAGNDSMISSWIIISIIIIELIIIGVLAALNFSLLNVLRGIAKESKSGKKTAGAREKRIGFFEKIWIKMNSFKPVKDEAQLDTGHNYDGIRELDNVTPPWFTTAFILSIIFAVVYMLRYHVFKTAPLQIEEFKIEMAQAEKEKAQYLATQDEIVDETTVTLLLDPSDLEAGKKLFNTHCVSCHMEDMGGGIGPNLVDEYWIHGGSVKDVFSVIKYGVREKGMVPWKDDLSPRQIAQVASYILSMQGTNPAKPKEPQGELYKEEKSQETSGEDTEQSTETEI